MSISVIACKHSIAEKEGENICIKCGIVLGYNQIESTNEWSTHSVFTAHKDLKMFNIIANTGKNLHLPSYAIQTILQISTKIVKLRIQQKYAILYATVYACRIHNIPRLLSDIFYEIEKTSNKRIRSSEHTLLRVLNKISNTVEVFKFPLQSPDKYYYLQAYLAKIQNLVISETNEKYFQTLQNRAYQTIKSSKGHPSDAAKNSILDNTSRIMKKKVMKIL